MSVHVPHSEGLEWLRLSDFWGVHPDDSFASALRNCCKVAGEPSKVLSKEMLGTECVSGKLFWWQFMEGRMEWASNGKTSRLAGAVARGKEDENSDLAPGPWLQHAIPSRGAFESLWLKQ